MSYKARRKNRILTIAAEKADEYAGMGYTVTDDDGNIIREPTESTLEGALQLIESLRAEIKAKDQEIETLRSELSALRDSNDEQPSERKPRKTKTLE